jgi:hypothetical protein
MNMVTDVWVPLNAGNLLISGGVGYSRQIMLHGVR